MRLLICMLLALLFIAPALADDWDGDQVIRKRPKKEQPKEDAESAENSEEDDEPLGMYFGNGDEFLENGAPDSEDEEADADDSDSAEETSDDSDAERQRSAILGPRHRAPQFAQPEVSVDVDDPKHVDEVQEEAETLSDIEVAEAEVEAAAEPLDETADSQIGVLSEELIEETSTPDEEANLQAPGEVVIEEAAEEVEEATEGSEAERAATSEETDAASENIDNPAHGWEDSATTGLSHYSSYPAMQAKAAEPVEAESPADETAEETEHEVEESTDHEHEHNEVTEPADTKPKRLKAYDPDEW